jgi:hypothetical protein
MSDPGRATASGRSYARAVTVHELVNALGAVLVGTAVGMLLRDDLGVHRPAPGTRTRANLIDVAVGLVGAVLLTGTLVLFP